MKRHQRTHVSRRQFGAMSSFTMGSLAVSGFVPWQQAFAGTGSSPVVAEPHVPPRVRRVIFLFMHGGPSHVDTFDYKPLLARDDGKPLPFALPPNIDGKM